MSIPSTEAIKRLLRDQDIKIYIYECVGSSLTFTEVESFFQNLRHWSRCGTKLTAILQRKKRIGTSAAVALLTLLCDRRLILEICSRKEISSFLREMFCNSSKSCYPVKSLKQKGQTMKTQKTATLQKKATYRGSRPKEKSPRKKRSLAKKSESFDASLLTRKSTMQPSSLGRHIPKRHFYDGDFALIYLRKTARSQNTPSNELLLMCAPEFQPYLGIELSENPALPDKGLQILLKYPPSNKRILQKLLRRIAGHPNASSQTLDMVLEIAKQVGIVDTIQNKIATRSKFSH